MDIMRPRKMRVHVRQGQYCKEVMMDAKMKVRLDPFLEL